MTDKPKDELAGIIDWLLSDESGSLMDGPRPTLRLVRKKLQYLEPEVATLEQRVERLERAIDEALRYKKRHKGYIFVNRNAWKIVYEALASQEEA